MDRASEALQHGAASEIPTPKAPLLPQAENFAFAIRMLGLDSGPNQLSVTQSAPPATTQVTTQAATPATASAVSAAPASDAVTQPPTSETRQPAQDQSQTSGDSQRDAQSSAPGSGKPGASAQPAGLPAAQQSQAASSHWTDATVFQVPDAGSVKGTPESTETARANLPLAAQETHLLTPELPKTSGTSEILLHLTNDQSSAAIRVAERAGTVNVSVHASDPVMRESLRSNLGDLSSQLNDQGWKADVMKSAAVATQSGQQDSHEGGQSGSHQQQSFGGDRHAQRDRRANGGQWQQEFDQQTLGGDAPSGGNG
jgi:hypothetical protein